MTLADTFVSITSDPWFERSWLIESWNRPIPDGKLYHLWIAAESIEGSSELNYLKMFMWLQEEFKRHPMSLGIYGAMKAWERFDHED